MASLWQSWVFNVHSSKSVKRNILNFDKNWLWFRTNPCQRIAVLRFEALLRFFGLSKILMLFFGPYHSCGLRFRPFLCGFSVFAKFSYGFTEISSGFLVPDTPLEAFNQMLVRTLFWRRLWYLNKKNGHRKILTITMSSIAFESSSFTFPCSVTSTVP